MKVMMKKLLSSLMILIPIMSNSMVTVKVQSIICGDFDIQISEKMSEFKDLYNTPLVELDSLSKRFKRPIYQPVGVQDVFIYSRGDFTYNNILVHGLEQFINTIKHFSYEIKDGNLIWSSFYYNYVDSVFIEPFMKVDKEVLFETEETKYYILNNGIFAFFTEHKNNFFSLQLTPDFSFFSSQHELTKFKNYQSVYERFNLMNGNEVVVKESYKNRWVYMEGKWFREEDEENIAEEQLIPVNDEFFFVLTKECMENNKGKKIKSFEGPLSGNYENSIKGVFNLEEDLNNVLVTKDFICEILPCIITYYFGVMESYKKEFDKSDVVYELLILFRDQIESGECLISALLYKYFDVSFINQESNS